MKRTFDYNSLGHTQTAPEQEEKEKKETAETLMKERGSGLKKTSIFYFKAEGKLVINMYPVYFDCSIASFLIIKHYPISNFY